MKKSFADVLNQLRKEAGLSLQALADASGINRRTLEEYASSRRYKTPSLHMGFLLEKALGVDIHVFADCDLGGSRGGPRKPAKRRRAKAG